MRELKKPRRRRQQERRSFAYLTLKNKSLARQSPGQITTFETFCKRSPLERNLKHS